MSQCNLQTDQARARWAAEYREARKVRSFMDAFPALPATLSISEAVGYTVFCAAQRVNGAPFPHGDALSFWIKTRLLWLRAKCRMHVCGPRKGALPA